MNSPRSASLWHSAQSNNQSTFNVNSVVVYICNFPAVVGWYFTISALFFYSKKCKKKTVSKTDIFSETSTETAIFLQIPTNTEPDCQDWKPSRMLTNCVDPYVSSVLTELVDVCRSAETEETLSCPATDEQAEEGDQGSTEWTIHGHHEECMSHVMLDMIQTQCYIGHWLVVVRRPGLSSKHRVLLRKYFIASLNVYGLIDWWWVRLFSVWTGLVDAELIVAPTQYCFIQCLALTV